MHRSKLVLEAAENIFAAVEIYVALLFWAKSIVQYSLRSTTFPLVKQSLFAVVF